MSRPKAKKNRSSSKYVSLEVGMRFLVREQGVVFTATLQEESTGTDEKGVIGRVYLKASEMPEPRPPFQYRVVVWGEASAWRHVLGMAQVLAYRTKGAIYRPDTATPIVSFMEPVVWDQKESEPKGWLSSHVYDKARILRRRGICREHLKAYLPHFTDENVHFSESGHILSDVDIFGRAMGGQK